MAAVLRRGIVGLRIVRFDAAADGIGRSNGTSQIVGRIVAAVEARGHNLFVVFRDEEMPGSLLRGDPLGLGLHHRDLLVHTEHSGGGEWHTAARPVAGHVCGAPCVVLHTEHSTAYCVGNAKVRVITAREAVQLWKEVLSASHPPSPKDVKEALAAHPDAEVGAVLAIVPGARHEGAFWRSEVLFLLRISPYTRIRDLPAEALHSIVCQYKRFAPNGARDGSVVRLDLRDRLWVHGRAGQLCRVCGTLIEAVRQGFGAGYVYFCPKCQGVKLRK